MLGNTKRGAAAAGAAALIIGASAVASSGLGRDNRDMTISVTSAAYSSELTTTSTDVSAVAEEHIPEQTSAVLVMYNSPEPVAEAAEVEIIPEPLSPETVDETAVTVYVSRSGKYHSRPDCSGMKNSTAMDIAQAESEGNIPCSRCFDTLSHAESSAQQTAAPEPVPADVVAVYVSSAGKYHSRSDCSGMKSYTEMERSSAEAAGHEPCKRCW